MGVDLDRRRWILVVAFSLVLIRYSYAHGRIVFLFFACNNVMMSSLLEFERRL